MKKPLSLKIGIIVVALIVCLFCIFPFCWMISVSFKVAPKILCKGKTARRLQFNLRGKVSPCPVSIPYHGEAGAVKGKSAAYLYGSGSPW